MSWASPHLRLSAAEKDLVEALAGALGSVTGTWVFYPLDTVKTRLQARGNRQTAGPWKVLWVPLDPDFSELALSPPVRAGGFTRRTDGGEQPGRGGTPPGALARLPEARACFGETLLAVPLTASCALSASAAHRGRWRTLPGSGL